MKHLKAYESVSHARRSIGEYIELYNRKRPHFLPRPLRKIGLVRRSIRG